MQTDSTQLEAQLVSAAEMALKQGSGSNIEESMLALYRAQVEEYVVKRGFAEPGDLEVTLLRTKDREAQVSITSKSGKNVQDIFRAAFPEPEFEIPPIHAAALKKPYIEPEQPKLNRAQRRAMRR